MNPLGGDSGLTESGIPAVVLADDSVGQVRGLGGNDLP